MSLRSGFFNSISGDRLYNADDINEFLKGIVSQNGIFANVGDELQVTLNAGMTLNVAKGKAIVNGHWLSITEDAETVTLDSAHATLNRIDRVVLRHDIANRSVGIAIIKGTPASIPNVPSIVRNSTYWDISLAYVRIPKQSTAIMASNIVDERLNSNVCGYIVGVVNQLNTSTFNAQLRAWELEQESEFETWSQTQKSGFESWFAELTEELNIRTYVVEYTKTVSGLPVTVNNITLNGYTRDTSDIVFVSVNGFTLNPSEYSITTSNGTHHLILHITGTETNTVFVRILKTFIGWETLIDSNNNNLISSNNENLIGG